MELNRSPDPRKLCRQLARLAVASWSEVKSIDMSSTVPAGISIYIHTTAEVPQVIQVDELPQDGCVSPHMMIAVCVCVWSCLGTMWSCPLVLYGTFWWWCSRWWCCEVPLGGFITCFKVDGFRYLLVISSAVSRLSTVAPFGGSVSCIVVDPSGGSWWIHQLNLGDPYT